ncbi:MAG: hypothetical protein GY797_32850, partial [Deltaproteobacteria bacterium]|nr:hypothetical protein [Deltaproteobacteria bacterium]
YVDDFDAWDDLLVILGKSEIDNPKRFLDHLDKAGGINKRDKLETLWSKIPSGDSSKANKLLDLANGNPATFDKFADAAELFNRSPVPENLPQPNRLYGYSSVDFKHFLERHTYDHFVFNAKNIQPDNTMWPAGTTPDDIKSALQEALNHLNAWPKLTDFQQRNLTISKGRRVVIGGEDDGLGGIMISQFYPLPENGTTFVNFSSAEMKAFRDLFN